MMVLTPNNRTSPSFTFHHSLLCCCPRAACCPHPCPAPLPHLLPPPCLPPRPCLGRQCEPSCWAGSRASTLAPGEPHVVVLLRHSPEPGQGSPRAGWLPGWHTLSVSAASQLPSLPAGRAGQSTASTFPCSRHLPAPLVHLQPGQHGAGCWHRGWAGAAPQPSLHAGADPAVAVPLPEAPCLSPTGCQGLALAPLRGYLEE